MIINNHTIFTYLLLFVSTCLLGMQTEIELIPLHSEHQSEDRLFIPLNVALQSQTFSDSYNTLPKTLENQRLYLHCSHKTALHIQKTLEQQHYHTTIAPQTDTLSSYLQTLNIQDLINIANTLNILSVPSLENKTLETLCTKMHNNSCPPCKALNCNLQKKFTALFFAHKKYDQKFIQPYANSLTLMQEHLNTDGFLAGVYDQKYTAHYFNPATKTTLFSITRGTPKKITHIYASHISKENICFDLRQLNINMTDIETCTSSNHNESLFLCSYHADSVFPKTCIIDTFNKNIITSYNSCCLGSHDHELYFVDNNTISLLNTQTNITTPIQLEFDSSTYDLQNMLIDNIACASNAPIIAIIMYNKQQRQCQLFLGIIHYNQTIKLHYLDYLASQRYFDYLYSKPIIRSLKVNNTGTIIHVQLCTDEYKTIRIYDVPTKTCRFCKDFTKLRYSPCYHYQPLFTAHDSLLIMPHFPLPDSCTFYNCITHNHWQQEGIIINGQPMEPECYHQETENPITTSITTTLTSIVDDVIRQFFLHLKNEQLPLVLCFIAEQSPGIVTLEQDDYESYQQCSSEIKKIINASYTIVNKQKASLMIGHVYDNYKNTMKSIISELKFLNGELKVIGILLVAYFAFFSLKK
jgi:hypothetical protein